MIEVSGLKQWTLQTTNSMAPLIIRVMLAAVVFPHGAQKLFGWFGGYGFSGTMGFFTETMGLPWIMGFLVIVLESLGALALLFGIGTRFLALGYIFLVLGIIFSSHAQYGFFMNWFGNQQGEGYEYFLLWLGMAVSLLISGGGRLALDRLLVVKPDG